MSSDNQFIYPGPMGVSGDYSSAILVQYGSPQEFNWTTNYNIDLTLILVQETAQTRDDTLATDTQAKSYHWNGRPSQNLHLSDIFFLALYNSSNLALPLFYSRYINVTTGAATPSSTTSSFSSSSTSSSSSSTVSTSSSSSPFVQPITTPASAAPTIAPKPKSNHVALGAGLGVGLGGAALLTAVLLYFLSRERRRKSGRPRPPEVYQLSEASK